MKNYCNLLLGALVATAFTSCSEDEVMAVDEGRPIEFYTDVLSRTSQNLKTDNLNEFCVYAYSGEKEVMPPTRFYKDGDKFVSDEKYYWPTSGEVNFVAYTPGLIDNKYVGCGNDENKIYIISTTFTPSEQKMILSQYNEAKYHCDVLLAKATGSKDLNEKDGISLNFNHVLSQVEFRAKSENKQYDVVIYQATLYNAHSRELAYDLNNNTLTINPNAKLDGLVNQPTTDGLKITSELQSLSIDWGNILLPPQNNPMWDVENDKQNQNKNAYIKIMGKVLDKQGNVIIPPTDNSWTAEETTARKGTKGWANWAIPMNYNFEGGKKYIINIDFTDGVGCFLPSDPTKPGEPILGSPIKISSVEVEEWVDGDDLSVEPNE